jgi:hypothetical protein
MRVLLLKPNPLNAAPNCAEMIEAARKSLILSAVCFRPTSSRPSNGAKRIGRRREFLSPRRLAQPIPNTMASILRIKAANLFRSSSRLPGFRQRKECPFAIKTMCPNADSKAMAAKLSF